MSATKFAVLPTLVLAILLICCAKPTLAQEGNRYSPNEKPAKLNGVSADECNQYKYFRSYDGKCTNPTDPMAGAALTRHFAYNDLHDARDMSGQGLRYPRAISNVVCKQTESNVFDEKIPLREFTTFFGQFVDHNIVQTSNDMRRAVNRRPINVPANDPENPHGRIPFNRNIKVGDTGKRDSGRGRRAINVLSHALDLFAVYGNNKLVLDLRSGNSGLLRTSGSGEEFLPLNDNNINANDAKENAPKSNSPSFRQMYFIAGDARSNENPQLTVLHTLFLRHHNFIARELAKQFPTWNDDELFENARRVNIAHFQKIVYEEYLPAMTSKKLGPCPSVDGQTNCFDETVKLAVSDVFATAAFRVGHTMVGNKIHRGAEDSQSAVHLDLKDAFFAPASQFTSDGLDTYLLGMLSHKAQKIDNLVVDALRIFLFENIPSEEGFDLISLNIQRGRDENLDTFSEIKKNFLGQEINSYADVSDDSLVQEKLQAAYKKPTDIEAFIGLITEDHAAGAPMGPTIIAVWMREFQRLRDGDYFFYQNVATYPPDLLNFPYLQGILDGTGDSMRDIILRHSNLSGNEVPQNIWRA